MSDSLAKNRQNGSVQIAVANDELVTVREAMRTLNRMIGQLLSGEHDQFVLMHRGRMVARLVPLHEGADR